MFPRGSGRGGRGRGRGGHNNSNNNHDGGGGDESLDPAEAYLKAASQRGRSVYKAIARNTRTLADERSAAVGVQQHTSDATAAAATAAPNTATSSVAGGTSPDPSHDGAAARPRPTSDADDMMMMHEQPPRPQPPAANDTTTTTTTTTAGCDAPTPPPPVQARRRQPTDLLKRFLPGLVAPPTLSPEHLPCPEYVAFTVANFDFTRELITAARAALAAAAQTAAERGTDVSVPRGLERPSGLPSTPDVKGWFGFVGRYAHTRPSAAGVPDVVDIAYGPPLRALAHTDYVCSVSLLVATCRNALRSAAHAATITAGLNDDADDGGSEAGEDDQARPPGAPGSDKDDNDDGVTQAAPESASNHVKPKCDDALRMSAPLLRLVTQAAYAADDTAALRFAGFLRYGGGGAWLFAALAAVHVPIDPDTERLLGEVFRTATKHLGRLCAMRPELAPMANASFAAGTAVTEATPWHLDVPRDRLYVRQRRPACEVRVELSREGLTAADVAAVYAVVVVIGKVFRQANPSLMPL